MNIFKYRVIVCNLKVVSKTISIELVKIQKKNMGFVKYIVFRNEANFEICDRTYTAFSPARPAYERNLGKTKHLSLFLTL